MNQFVMDKREQDFFIDNVINRLQHVKHVCRVTQKPMEQALVFLNNICQDDYPNALIHNIHNVRHSFGKEYAYSVANYTPTVHYSELMWEYMYLLAFYLKSGNPLWMDYALPEMMAMLNNEFVRKEIEYGKKLVLECIEKNKRFQQAVKELDYKTSDTHLTDNSPYAVAPHRKVDVMKVMYYMFKNNMFVNSDGTPAKGIKTFMNTIGKFFNDDFSAYAQHIGKAKAMDAYMNVFNDLHKSAEEDYLNTN